AAAAQVGYCKDSASLEQDEIRRVECWRQADIESAIAGEEYRTVAVFRQILPGDEKHRDLRAVLRGVPHLRGLVVLAACMPTRIAERCQLSSHEVVAVVRCRLGE